MSFRTRLTLFFLLIVVVPMVALGVVVMRLVADSEQGKASARGAAYATAAVQSYRRIAAHGARHARVLAGDPALAAALRSGDASRANDRARALARQLGLARVSIARRGRLFVELGDRSAIAAGAARVPGADGGAPTVVETSTITAAHFVRTSSADGVRVAIVRDDAVLAASVPNGAAERSMERDSVSLQGTEYAVARFRTTDFGGSADTIAILSDTTATSSAVARGRWIAMALLAGFLLLAFFGALRISRQLHGQLGRFLTAARRIGGGDFSTTVPVEGEDEFAALGREFNKMSRELEQRVEELDRERGRLRESIQRIGATFAANLDRFALLEIGTQTAVDAVEAACGRATVRTSHDGELLECARVGEIAGAETAIAAAEAQVRALGGPASVTEGDTSALAAPIARSGDPDAPLGIVAVARQGRPFTPDELALVGSLARQTGISLENVELHDEVKRQAVTDELTGLFNYGRFQEVVAAEVAAAQRFGQPLGLVMLDIDNFKRVNDTYGHQQGDLVLREVACVLRDCTREIDEPARYGGEEMAVALPQTDLEGAEVIAERVRTAVEALELPRLDGGGTLRVTVSCGVAASDGGEKDALIAAADAALYRAKHAGKNRTVSASALATAEPPVEEAPR